MKTLIVSSLVALSLIAGVAGSANAANDGYPQWAHVAFDAGN